MCSLTTSTYACSHRHKKYWTYCPVVATQKDNPKYKRAKCCQGPESVREEKEEKLKKKCDDCRKEEKAVKVEKAKQEGWFQELKCKTFE